MKKIGNWIGVFLLLSLLLAGQAAPLAANASGTIAYVVPGGLTTGSCSSWAHACDLQHALGVATPNYQLWVKQGTYKPTSTISRTISFVLKNGVGVYGGFAGTEIKLTQRNPKTHVTVLSGDIGTHGDSSDNVYNVLFGNVLNSTAVLDGFTVSGGNANGSSTSGWGGGMLNVNSSPTLTNVIFDGNLANLGGGMYNTGSSPILTNVTFHENSATLSGGGMDNENSSPTLTNVTFSGNKALGGSGGGMYNHHSDPTVKNVILTNNSAISSGGGMYNYGSNPSITGGTFSGNSTSTGGDGGGMENATFSNPILTNVTFSSNKAPGGQGGGMYNHDNSISVLENVTFNSNSANQGGGISDDTGGNPTLTNVTFNGNYAENDGGGMYNNDTHPNLTSVTFSGNFTSSGGVGGGMENNSNSSPTLTNMTFSGNYAYTGGGIANWGGSSPTLTNVTFHANSASFGGGMENENSNPPLTNVTFSGNSISSGGDGGGMYNYNSHPYLYDNIFWNDGSEIFNDSSTPEIDDSLVAGGCPVGATCSNVIHSDPLLGPLVNNGGFTKTMALAAGSPAIDAGGLITACAPKDQRGVKRPQGPHCDMGAYEAPVTKTFPSTGSLDGTVLESGENTNVGGGSPNTTGPTLTLGDNSSRRQYRLVLSFSTASLPDNASISSIKLKLKRSSVTPPATNPISLLHGIMLDMKKGFFGSTSSLQTSDFQATGTKTVGAYSPALSGGFYTINLPSSAFTSINKVNTNGGLTQIRLRFKLDDNNNSIANTLNLISGNNPTAANRPALIIVYTTP